MFLRCSTRKKNGKEHRYWSIVENKRCAGDKVVQRHVLYLGEINDHQQAGWQKSIEIFEQGHAQARTVALFSTNSLYTPCDCRVKPVGPNRGVFPCEFTCSSEMLHGGGRGGHPTMRHTLVGS